MKSIKCFFIFAIIFFVLSGAVMAQDNMTIYHVKKGDNLSTIAEQFNVSLEKIIKANQISNPDLIRVGQKLNIPQKQITYNVKNGDTLWKIADYFNISIKEIIEMNEIDNPDKIYTGQTLALPINLERERYILASRSQRINYIWPVQGKISSPFGWRNDPFTKTREFHNGLDIAISMGSPVYASADGVVTHSGWSSGYGKLIIIQHRDEKKTYYGHNLELIVKKGERVKQGRIIALSGNSGRSTGPHLHFEFRVNGRPVDPMSFLNQRYLQNGFTV